MQNVRRKQTRNQRRETRRVVQQAIPLDDGTLTTPVTVQVIQALIPLGLKAVEDVLVNEVTALVGPRYARDDERPDVVRWGATRVDLSRRPETAHPVHAGAGSAP